MYYIFLIQSLTVSVRPYLISLTPALLLATTTAFALEESATASSDVPYQSAFEDYHAAGNDILIDWRANKQSLGGSGHTDHQTQGMQHDMQPSEMNSAKSTMGHSGMDHSKMAHYDTPLDSHPNNSMNHDNGNMSHQHMNHEMSAAKSTTSTNKKSASEISAMDHSNMTSVEHQHSTSNDSLGNMDHSKMANMGQPVNPAKSNELESATHTHGSGSGKQGHDIIEPMPNMDKTAETSAATAQPTSTGFNIFPNMHPVVVHFPIALTLISLLFALGAHVLRKQSAVPLLAAAGHLTLWLAAMSAVIAVVLGWFAFNSGMTHDDAGHAAMLLHRKWAVPTALGLVVLAGWDVWKARVNQVMSFPALALLFLLSGAIAITAWLGGEIVYRHGIGVMSLPASEGAGHNHQHNGANEFKHIDDATTSDEHSDHQHDVTQGESHEH